MIVESKKRQPQKAVKPTVNQQQLRAIYEDSQSHGMFDDTIEGKVERKKNMLVGPIKEQNH